MLTKVVGVTKEKFLREYNKILKRGLSCGLGEADGKMCIEAAVCTALGLDFDDHPKCTGNDIAEFKITLNDHKGWDSDEARSKGLRWLGIAQLGSKNLDDKFFKRVEELIFEKYFPKIKSSFKHPMIKATFEVYLADKSLLDDFLKVVHTLDNNDEITNILSYLHNNNFENYISSIISEFYPNSPQQGLLDLTKLALRALKDIKSPGVQWLPAAQRK